MAKYAHLSRDYVDLTNSPPPEEQTSQGYLANGRTQATQLLPFSSSAPTPNTAQSSNIPSVGQIKETQGGGNMHDSSFILNPPLDSSPSSSLPSHHPQKHSQPRAVDGNGVAFPGQQIRPTKTSVIGSHPMPKERPSTPKKRNADIAFGSGREQRPTQIKNSPISDEVGSRRGRPRLERPLQNAGRESGKEGGHGGHPRSSTIANGHATSTPRFASQPTSPKVFRRRFTEEEDRKLVYLKEELKWPWSDIARHFPNRSKATLQVHYSTSFSQRHHIGDLGKATVHRNETQSQPTPNGASQPLKAPVQGQQVPAQDPAPPISSGRSVEETQRQETIQVTDASNSSSQNAIKEKIEIASPTQASHKPVYSIAILPPRKLQKSENHARAPVTSKPKPPGNTVMSHCPYLSFGERNLLKGELLLGVWQPSVPRHLSGATLHVDFTKSEMKTLVVEIESLIKRSSRNSTFGSKGAILGKIKMLIQNETEDMIYSIAQQIHSKGTLKHRDPASLRSFMIDTSMGMGAKTPQSLALGGVHRERAYCGLERTSSQAILRRREMGVSGNGACRSNFRTHVGLLRDYVQETLGPKLSFTGTSGDVNTVSWSPNGSTFAVGSACLTDPSSMQYNLPNNLLLGDADTQILKELPDHYTDRSDQRPTNGVNSSHEMHVSQDPRLFSSISVVAFSPNGRSMYSAGYDGKLRAWDISRGVAQASVHFVYDHNEDGVVNGVDLLAVSKNGTVATGCRKQQDGIVVFGIGEDQEAPIGEFLYTKDKYTSDQATKRDDMFPSSLKFDPFSGKYLLAGFCTQSHDDAKDKFGDVRLWDINHKVEQIIYGGVRNVFDCAWNIHGSIGANFAVACTAGVHVNRGVHSVVKLYDRRTEMSNLFNCLELECPARDMNDVFFSPFDVNIVSVSCTDGVTYVWDLRTHHQILHKLTHGEPLLPLRHDMPREDADTGVRFNAWGHDRRRLYTGSSDGVVKAWDVYQTPEDAFVKNVVALDSGIMSGSFNQDMDRLLVGEVKGTFHVHEVGSDLNSMKESKGFDLISSPPPREWSKDVTAFDEDSGTNIAHRSVLGEEISLLPLGGLPTRQAVQGPTYSGPFDPSPDADDLRELANAFQRKMRVDSKSQCQLPLCLSSALRYTEEEAGDSRRSIDRIPDSLRKGSESKQPPTTRTVSVAAKCTNCGATVRPRVFEGKSEAALRTQILCERCEFTCLRCGGQAAVSADIDVLRCFACDLQWDIGVLGYDVVSRRHQERDVIASKGRNLIQKVTVREGHTDGNSDDISESGDLSEYYHSLWMDRPPSPPL